MNSFLKLDKLQREEFCQSKYEYYQKFNTWVVIISCLSSITYFISDCQLTGGVAWNTLLPRTFILLPLLLFLWIKRHIRNYRIMSILTFLVGHAIMWCTIWAIVYLPNRAHASEGFIIMQFVFFSMAFCAPFEYAVIFHTMVIGNILLSNLFLHYENIDIMLSLGLPCVIAICGADFVMSSVYFDHFITKNQLEDALVTDNLTQVYNRNKLESILDGGRFKKELGSPIAILLLDIDLFKNVNDTYGHDKGDFMLKQIAKAIKKCVRGNDVIIRWGGEEFLVIMPHCNVLKAKEVAVRMQNTVANMEQSVCPITISIGISEYNNADYLDSINRADEALYAAKRGGRNQIISYEEME